VLRHKLALGQRDVHLDVIIRHHHVSQCVCGVCVCDLVRFTSVPTETTRCFSTCGLLRQNQQLSPKPLSSLLCGGWPRPPPRPTSSAHDTRHTRHTRQRSRLAGGGHRMRQKAHDLRVAA
jgi:hypothetical protein